VHTIPTSENLTQNALKEKKNILGSKSVSGLIEGSAVERLVFIALIIHVLSHVAVVVREPKEPRMQNRPNASQTSVAVSINGRTALEGHKVHVPASRVIIGWATRM
jgi:hypothetical protein